MSNKTLIVLFFLALIIGGTAAGIFITETSGSKGGAAAGSTVQEDASTANQPMNHSSHVMADTATAGSTEEATPPSPSPSPEATAGTVQEGTAALPQPKPGQAVKGFTLTAMESNWELASGATQAVWTYNGTVPGQEIRVTQGDFVRITLKNELNVPVTIHWHGYPVPAGSDGVPGVTQEAVKPGEAYTYEFSADVAGTYWYHSHQESSVQVDKGLYGALVVEPKQFEQPDKDFTLILDEWMSEGGDAHSAHGSASMSDEEMMAAMYNIYTVNGKSGSLITPLETKLGDTVRLRFINAGYRSHGIHIPGEFRVVSTDGQDIAEPATLQNQIVTIAPGERYDVELNIVSPKDFAIDAHDDNKYNDQLVIPVKVSGSKGEEMEVQHDHLTAFDLLNYGKPAESELSKVQKFALEYTAVLNSKMNGNQQVYTINDKVFSELPALQVKTGDYVKLTFENKGTVDHPMHVHGHFFQVLEKNGVKVESTIMKDTVLVKPGEKIVIAFKADNPGNWMIHCHELHHAAGGMAQQLAYTDYKSGYTPPSNAANKPE
ncbi:Multicopper oxidase with three cupredoxin domains (includes cell division protein FtsP and spore coat protein CotA) [Paenibacillus sophorae]|uniref:Multicopper oxidase family protein n=1 Tax=Paenibacillus sophorae TaxID=1333845 RepID=A0A1H8VI24_9BACL|nr:multicopper oxidase family protein [Paenibacillus sophorae]QWU15413.1 multicopper oxidase family protein [Paenibacillus sophorae]SEP14538.1 Multicopper oxidase with three cupredoxin domains (includes cell division protein FtsP and spore coat protein CotA) [Paenibacillus sophorae]